MSVSLWRYNPDKCDSSICRGDCDLCGMEKEDEDDEDESPIITKASPASLGVYKKENSNE